jgi:tetratricopeptide (TPR) repeat protein
MINGVATIPRLPPAIPMPRRHASQEDYTEELQYHQCALEIKISTLGENHIRVSTAYFAKGSVYSRKEEHHRALECYEEGLRIEKALFGEDHPDPALSYSTIAEVYCHKKEYDRALECLKKGLRNRPRAHMGLTTHFWSTATTKWQWRTIPKEIMTEPWRATRRRSRSSLSPGQKTPRWSAFTTPRHGLGV